MKIHDVTPGKNRFCGPAAVSALTGRPVDEVVRVFHAKTPHARVKGTHLSDLVQVLFEYGLTVKPHAIYDYADNRPTLAGWLKVSKTDRVPGRVFLLNAGHHWVVVSGRRAVCGITKTVVSVRQYPKRRARVTRVWEVKETGKPRLRSMPECAQQLVETRKRTARISTRFSYWARKAKQAGIEVDKEDRYWMVYPPEALSERADWVDPYEGDHMADDTHEARERIQRYLLALAAVQSAAHPSVPEAL